jgi:hypothetical protein
VLYLMSNVHWQLPRLGRLLNACGQNLHHIQRLV